MALCLFSLEKDTKIYNRNRFLDSPPQTGYIQNIAFFLKKIMRY
jgi:hypothetical protein